MLGTATLDQSLWLKSSQPQGEATTVVLTGHSSAVIYTVLLTTDQASFFVQWTAVD